MEILAYLAKLQNIATLGEVGIKSLIKKSYCLESVTMCEKERYLNKLETIKLLEEAYCQTYPNAVELVERPKNIWRTFIFNNFDDSTNLQFSQKEWENFEEQQLYNDDWPSIRVKAKDEQLQHIEQDHKRWLQKFPGVQDARI